MANSNAYVLLIIPLLWNILTVIYFVYQARAGRLTPMSFALVFVLGFSITVSGALFIAIYWRYGAGLREVGFALFAFLFNFLIGFPIAYFASKYWLVKYSPTGFLKKRLKPVVNRQDVQMMSEIGLQVQINVDEPCDSVLVIIGTIIRSLNDVKFLVIQGSTSQSSFIISCRYKGDSLRRIATGDTIIVSIAVPPLGLDIMALSDLNQEIIGQLKYEYIGSVHLLT